MTDTISDVAAGCFSRDEYCVHGKHWVKEPVSCPACGAWLCEEDLWPHLTACPCGYCGEPVGNGKHEVREGVCFEYEGYLADVGGR
ncbi:MAG TPA: hypothetical protein VF981_07430 [Gemmatimonadaceae bacterium]